MTQDSIRYRRSDSLQSLAPALVKLMASVGKAAKSSTNPHFRSKYADLATCHDAALTALEANGFAFPMFPSTEPGALSVTALLIHESGEFLEGTLTIPLKEGANAQDVLSAETYARRGLYCMVGVVPDDDDDGERAVGRGQPQDTRDRRQAPTPRPEAKAAPAVSQRPASTPPGPLHTGPTAADCEHPDCGPEDSRPAQSDEALDKALQAAFSSLRKDFSPPVLNTWAKKVTGGKVPSGWTVSDGRRFLAAYQAGERPL